MQNQKNTVNLVCNPLERVSTRNVVVTTEKNGFPGADKGTDRKTDRQTDRHRDRQTEGQT